MTRMRLGLPRGLLGRGRRPAERGTVTVIRTGVRARRRDRAQWTSALPGVAVRRVHRPSGRRVWHIEPRPGTAQTTVGRVDKVINVVYNMPRMEKAEKNKTGAGARRGPARAAASRAGVRGRVVNSLFHTHRPLETTHLRRTAPSCLRRACKGHVRELRVPAAASCAAAR